MQFETITRGKKEFALLPVAQLKALVERAEMLADVEAYDRAMAALESGEDEIIPFSIIERRAAGESPLRIWREYRGLTQDALAGKSSVSRAMIAAIEVGNKQGSVSTLRKLAGVLDVSIEQLMVSSL